MFDADPPPRRGLLRWRRGGDTDGDELVTGPSINSARIALGVLVGISLLCCGFAFVHGEDEIVDDRQRLGFYLSAGQCVNNVNATEEIDNVVIVDCAQPHEAEVFATLKLRDRRSYPEPAELEAEISPKCFEALEAYAPGVADDPAIAVSSLFPDRLAWATGDREATCLAGDRTTLRSGSLH